MEMRDYFNFSNSNVSLTLALYRAKQEESTRIIQME